MECVASRMRGSVECGPVTAHPLATVSAAKREALLRAIAALSYWPESRAFFASAEPTFRFLRPPSWRNLLRDGEEENRWYPFPWAQRRVAARWRV